MWYLAETREVSELEVRAWDIAYLLGSQEAESDHLLLSLSLAGSTGALLREAGFSSAALSDLFGSSAPIPQAPSPRRYGRDYALATRAAYTIAHRFEHAVLSSLHLVAGITDASTRRAFHLLKSQGISLRKLHSTTLAALEREPQNGGMIPRSPAPMPSAGRVDELAAQVRAWRAATDRRGPTVDPRERSALDAETRDAREAWLKLTEAHDYLLDEIAMQWASRGHSAAYVRGLAKRVLPAAALSADQAIGPFEDYARNKIEAYLAHQSELSR